MMPLGAEYVFGSVFKRNEEYEGVDYNSRSLSLCVFLHSLRTG